MVASNVFHGKEEEQRTRILLPTFPLEFFKKTATSSSKGATYNIIKEKLRDTIETQQIRHIFKNVGLSYNPIA